uniref:Uncharacterized protein n=2 Tax=unclassified Caudoviricetes TaxID=2788787 RepID=A0A8S5PJB4_9CAUD|nr:MAG TPA: hypothetical protein [Siphoviridae sp. ctHeV6]DAE06497.1 MAG TPA: hypothetical protein [Siphoviridae sp. ctmP19]
MIAQYWRGAFRSVKLEDLRPMRLCVQRIETE